MTLAEIRDRVQTIRLVVRDSEAAHAHEDALYQAVLVALAEGTLESPAEAARLALMSRDIVFSRWCG